MSWFKKYAMDETGREEPLPDQPEAQSSNPVETPRTRNEIVAKLKDLGLPATGKTEWLSKMLEVATKNPATWSRDEFKMISPYLYIHQDIREGNSDRSESVMEKGLEHGMVDTLAAIDDKRSWSWARGLLGGRAYLFFPSRLKWKSKDSPWLGGGTMPFYYFDNKRGDDVYQAITGGGHWIGSSAI